MTCFWNSLLSGIPKDLFLEHSISQPIHLVVYLKKYNLKTDHVKFNGVFLSEKRKDENFEAISSFQSNSIYGGYFCAFEEPFLFLVCELFKINIHHNYNGYIAHYIYDGITPNKCIYLRSNTRHMQFICLKNE